MNYGLELEKKNEETKTKKNRKTTQNSHMTGQLRNTFDV